MNYAVDFDAAAHTYAVGGIKRPSVTGLIAAAFGVGYFPPDWYLDRGRKVHQASVYLEDGDLDWSTVSDEIRGYLEAFEKVLKDLKPVNALPPETKMFHSVLGYCGTPDRVWMVRGDVWIVDLKTGVHGRKAALQTKGYELLFKQVARELNLQTKIVRRFVLKLDKDGRFKFVPHTDDSDDAVFRACCAIINDKMNHGARVEEAFSWDEAFPKIDDKGQ